MVNDGPEPAMEPTNESIAAGPQKVMEGGLNAYRISGSVF